jgi:hypothetical protein
MVFFLQPTVYSPVHPGKKMSRRDKTGLKNRLEGKLEPLEINPTRWLWKSFFVLHLFNKVYWFRRRKQLCTFLINGQGNLFLRKARKIVSTDEVAVRCRKYMKEPPRCRLAIVSLGHVIVAIRLHVTLDDNQPKVPK